MARLLAAYFMLLPLLLTYHSTHHTHKPFYNLEYNLEGQSEYAEITSDCSICDLYHSQAATIALPTFNVDVKVAVASLQFLCDHPAKNILHFLLLRGPPNL